MGDYSPPYPNAATDPFSAVMARPGPKAPPRGAMTGRDCERCGKVFLARAADVARGWGKFCSKSCKATAPTPAPAPALPVAVEVPALAGDDKILWGVVANAGRLSAKNQYRWSHVMDATGLGSQSSIALCRRFGFDPDEKVGGHEEEEGT
ncbi:MAG TPA: hypothetical protein VIG97_07305 [Luteimonas sp.]